MKRRGILFGSPIHPPYVLSAVVLAAGLLLGGFGDSRTLGFDGVFGAVVARGNSGRWAIAQAAPAGPTASRTEVKEIWSEALGRTLPYLVYLPPGYDSDDSQRYPVLYMLHGLRGTYMSWPDRGLLTTADRLITAGEVPPFIIVLPQGESGYWVDHADGGPQWGTYVTRDLLGAVDAGYRTLPSREFRAIGGNSMGAHGAFQLGMNNPDKFSAVGGHSLVLRTFDSAFPYYGTQNYFNEHDPVYLARVRPERARRLKVWVDIGDSDPWEPAAESFHKQLNSERITHTWREWTGAHDDAYWSAHVEDYLRFYGGVFAQNAADSRDQDTTKAVFGG